MDLTSKPQHVLDIASLSSEEINSFLELGEALKEVLKRPIPKVPTLRGRLVVLLFYEPSTRTRFSFDRAAKALSADTLTFSAKGSSIEKGESLLDTVKNLKAIGAELIVIRHPMEGAPHFIAKHINIPVVNAGDGTHEHPTQALLDLLTVKERLGDFSGIKVAILGDIKHSRVAKSDILAFQKMGAKVYVSGPAYLLPTPLEEEYFRIYPGGFKVCYDPKEAIRDADVVIALRVQKERHGKPLIPSFIEYQTFFGLTFKELELIKKGALLMHPGPINWGVELSPEVEQYPFQVILDQVENGVAIRMAILLKLLTDGKTYEVTH
ncbi:aspartate carbamoyltransferase catalytic subunit [Thermodesulfobacterium commune]|uniref:Aspartate carbamoyltransferase n=1 Tax=Thermodesulfobacterium commune DSM 2178 TaxID=289377 RepID=A0A075WVP0_9BACT|nr:aspartate carbamoyltransferase catalytic subunit [Thermodesulfobacterium commune]AIH04533.1 aspartate carbamoyltransferase [Thermodesulfobacterium commune DSM 2178]HCE79714.1 aspartate carbamoyltransferase catalytic subunit [Thermodesulfobacterium commune]